METIDRSALERGNPKKWIKTHLPKELIKSFFIGMILALPCFWIGAFFYLLVVGNRKDKSKGHNQEPDEFSMSFGINDTTNFNISLAFRLVYSLFWVFLNIVSILLIIFLAQSSITWWLAEGACIVFSLIQIKAVLTFKNKIIPYACSECGYANTRIYCGSSNFHSWEREEYAGKGGGSEQVGSVYIDGKSVGSVYRETSTYDTYQTVQYESCDEFYQCSHCGHEYEFTHTSSKNIGYPHSK